MAETNLYKLLSGLYTAASNINTKVGNKNAQNGSAFEQLTALSTAVNGKFTPRLANGTSGLVYSGGDVTIAQGIISLKNGVVDTAELAAGAVTADKLASTVSSQIGHGETAYGKVSGDGGTWHSHTNKETLDGIGGSDITNWNDAYTKRHEHSNKAALDGITTGKIANWDAAAGANHSHTNKTVLDGITSAKVADWDKAATSAHFHTNKAVLDGITSDKITSWDNGAKISGVTLEKLSTPTAGYAASYQLKVNGSTTNIPTIDIVKDQFIKSAKFGWSTVKTSVGTGWVESKPSTGTYYPCIKIEVWTNVDGDTSSSDTTATPIYVPLADVFQEYVGGANIKVDGNVIAISETIPDANIASASSWNTAATRAADWNTSKGTVVKTSTATTFKDGTVVLGTGTSQTVKNSEYTIATGSASFGADTLATAPAITGYIAAQGFQKSADMGSYVTGANLDADTIVMGAGGKAVKKGVKIVTASGAFESATSGSMVPTAGAVSSYFAGKNTVTRNGGTALTTNNLVVGAGNNTLSASTIAVGNVITATTNLTSGKLVVATGNKAISGTSYGVNTASGSVGAANQISTDDALTGYFASKNENFVSASDDLTSGQIILGNDAKTVKQSGLTIGTTSGSIGTDSTASATIPRSDAVSSYVANKTANMVTGSGLTDGNLVIGNNNGAVKNSGIASGNVVTNTTGNATKAECIIVAAAANKTVKATAYTINTTTTSGGISDTANQIPNVQAVKAYTDAVAGNATDDAKNYLLNGNAATDTGVTEWAGGDTTVGSLAELNKKVNALLTSIK